LESFTELKNFVDNPRYNEQRQESLNRLDIDTIDPPIVNIVSGFSRLPYCFTLQSCYGHFLYSGQKDPYNIEPLPISINIVRVEYKIAYITLCIENNSSGNTLFEHLRQIPEVDPEYIQFGCAEWFWERQVNTYALQVEPQRYMTKDKVCVGYQGALHIEKVRNQFFAQLKKLLQARLKTKEYGQQCGYL
jgi:hypothetical protein